ncbi:MAG: HD domain-containing protein [Desulfobacteraceae bacterium]|jgi:putative nucleotidyltransferase with HDIG domain
MKEEGLQRLIEVIEEIARGNYSNDIMPLTAEGQPDTVRVIAEAMAMMMVKVEAREYRLETLIDELRDLNETIKRNTVSTVSAMANALAARDTYTEGHAARVGDLAHRMALHLGFGEEEAEFVRIAGALHDIGKIGFSDRLFQDHGTRNPPDVVKEIVRHPETGAEILKDLDFLGPALDYVRCHHERPDGKGYPRRLSGEEIPAGARLLAVADGFDAMTTDRPYQKGMTVEKALSVLKKNAGTKWDAECVLALEAVLTQDAPSVHPET